jgi:hypothetical protein
MTPYEILLLLHILLFVYWLGGDLGVFYSSGFVVDSSLSTEARLTAAKIMLGCDLVPRICMSLVLTIGGLLAHYVGIEHASWQLLGIIVLGPLWLSMVLILHFKHDAPYINLLTKIDLSFRWVLIIGILASCFCAYTTGRLEEAPWLIAKLLAFAFLVFCGLMIRIQIKGFISSYVKLMQDNYTDADNKEMEASLNRVRPWVVTIWLVLVFEAFLGIVKPWI